jgi:hypothetical protein
LYEVQSEKYFHLSTHIQFDEEELTLLGKGTAKVAKCRWSRASILNVPALWFMAMTN